MGSLTDLLKWKKTITLINSAGKPILGKDKKPLKVYIRVVGDQALKEAYSLARVASSEKRAALRDKESVDYKTEVDIFSDATREECLETIKIANATGWTSRGMSEVVRPDEITIETVAVDPDAPTLEEQEKVDALNKEQDEKYTAEIQEYVVAQSKALESELAPLDLASIRVVAMTAQETIGPLATFMERLQIEKTWRGCYDDEKHQIPSFSNLQEFLDSDTGIKNQLLSEYTKLEISGEDSKN